MLLGDTGIEPVLGEIERGLSGWPGSLNTLAGVCRWSWTVGTGSTFVALWNVVALSRLLRASGL